MSYLTGEAIADDDDYDDDYDNDNKNDHDYDEEREDSDDEPEEDDYETQFSRFGGRDEVITRDSRSAQDNDKCESEIAAADTSAESISTANRLVTEEILPILEKLAPETWDESSPTEWSCQDPNSRGQSTKKPAARTDGYCHGCCSSPTNDETCIVMSDVVEPLIRLKHKVKKQRQMLRTLIQLRHRNARVCR
ncbi:translocase of chloroplast 108, chloroplastic-like [Scyliorhinus canicula]|uniref:translocase of chloroplast 108, chloroplastic-like n=1 Tax=Scyliorhinus canicula TaxID=7830 RepID=UPI0018F57A85|nr:translocase of chloroplast 108, chloroplastic-like [Scyliorhinus canicula]